MVAECQLHPLIKRFLLYIPYTMLSALIVRGAMQASSGMELAAILGIGAAGICSWFKGGLVLSVISSILVSFLILVL